jgi:MFS family permease
MVQMGWRAVFLFFGLGSLVWLWPWLVTARHASVRADARSNARAPSFISILKRREAWGASLGHFSNAYTFYFVISWLPLYLVKARGFSVVEMAELGSLIYLVYAVSTWLMGWLTDRWLHAGANVNRVRKTAAVACHVVVAASMLCCAVGDATVSVASLFVAGIGFGLNQAGIFAIGQTLAGPDAGGKWMGVQNSLANLAGIAAPIITGLVVDRTGQFFWAFIVAGCVSLTGILGWAVLIGRVSPVNWRGHSTSADRWP